MPAPTFVQEAETAYAATQTTQTTGTFDVLTYDVLVAYGFNETNNAVTISNNGAALTWLLAQDVAVASYTRVGMWTTVMAADRTGLTVTFTASTGMLGGNVLTFRASAGPGASQKTNVASGAPSLSLTTTRPNSAVVSASGDWNAVDGASRTWRTINSITPTSGNTLERTYVRDAARATFYGAYWTDVGAAGAQTTGLSAPSGQKYSIVSLEVLGTFPPALTMPQMRT